jgi:hypothetical protein
MIRTEMTTEVPQFDTAVLVEHSQRELEMAGDLNGLRGSPTVLVYDDDKFLLAFNVQKGKNFLQPAEIFLVVGKAYSARYARNTKHVFDQMKTYHNGFITLVDVTFGRGCRFAEFLGFRPKGKPFDYANRRFQMYEVY